MEQIKEVVKKDPTLDDTNDFTDWANAPTVQDLKQDYLDAQSDQDAHISDVETWLDNMNITGSAKIKPVKNKSSIVPKLIRKQAEWRYASLSEPFLSTEDIFDTAPATHEDKKSAIQNGLVLNNQFNTQLQKVKFIDDFVRTVVDEGTAIVRVGWEYQEETVEVEVPDFTYTPSTDPAVAQLHQQLHGLMQQDPKKFEEEVPPEVQEAHKLSMESGQPIIATQTGSHMEDQVNVLRNQPSIEVCGFRNISIDPTCMGDLEKAEFVIYSFETSLSELEKEGKYTNLDQINIEANSILGDPDHYSEDDSNFNFSDKPRQKFVAYEYWGFWDINDDGITKPIVATYVGDVMIRLEENPFPDQAIPFVSAQYLPVRKSVYGEPDGALLEDNQKIIGAVTRGMIDIMARAANGQQGNRKDALDVTNKRKYDRGQDYEFNPAVDPKQAFHTHKFEEIPTSAPFMIQMQHSEAESLTGIKAFSNSGLTGDALGTSVGGIKSALDASSKRELGILRRLSECMKQVARKITAMNAVFLSEEEVVRITDEEFITVKRDDLEGNFDIKLTISTPEADEHKAQELAFMLQTLGNTVDPGMTTMILSDIARLRNMPELAKRLELYKPQPDPIAQEKAMLEVELLKAQIANENAKAHENNANGELDLAKTQETLAKTANISSDTDQKNLDFVEQENSTKHDREVDKIKSQSEAQTKMKIVEGVMKANQTNQ